MGNDTIAISVSKEELDATGRVILEAGRWCKIFYEDGQPEQTDCDYCNEDSDGYVKPIEKNGHAFVRFGMDGWELSLRAKGWHGGAKIRFCPMCGRRLER